MFNIEFVRDNHWWRSIVYGELGRKGVYTEFNLVGDESEVAAKFGTIVHVDS